MTHYDDDAAIDRYADGFIDGFRGRKTVLLAPDPDYLAGFRAGREQRQVRVVMPRKPEGYYHAPLGTFD